MHKGMHTGMHDCTATIKRPMKYWNKVIVFNAEYTR